MARNNLARRVQVLDQTLVLTEIDTLPLLSALSLDASPIDEMIATPATDFYREPPAFRTFRKA